MVCVIGGEGTPRDFDNWQSQTLRECWDLRVATANLLYSSYDSRHRGTLAILTEQSYEA